MASSKPQCSDSVVLFEEWEVQVLDSNDPHRASTCSSGMCGPSEMAGPSGPAGPSRMSLDFSSSDEDYIPETAPTGRRIEYNAEELRSLWSWKKLYKNLGTAEQCIEFAEEKGLIPMEKHCAYHKKPMALTTGAGAGHLGKFRCRKSNCRDRTSVSRAAGTWFENIKLPITVIFQLMFAFSDKLSYQQIKREVAEDDGPVLSTASVTDWYSYCRDTITIYELEHQEAERKIGGPGKIVQIDQAKFGKRKYSRRQIENHWVIGMIGDKNDDLRLEVCPDNERTTELLVQLIQKHVEVGSIIHTDHWRAYLALPDHGYTHRQVNHSDPEHQIVAPDGTPTQRIDCQWRGFKKVFREKRNKRNFTDWLIECSWRRKISTRHGDPFEELIKSIKYLYPVPNYEPRAMMFVSV